jgi:hypothetical protein
MKLVDLLIKGYATVHGQCSQEVKDKPKESDTWERIQSKQPLYELIQKIKRIRVGFDDHKQEIFNLVQSLRLLFINTQNKEHSVEEYGRNFHSLWDTVEVFGGSLRVHKGMVDAMVLDPKRVVDVKNPTQAKTDKAYTDVSEAVKAALLIIWADKQRYGRLKDNLANNYLLGTNQYPGTFEEALCILENYQEPKTNHPFRGSSHSDGVGTGGGAGQGRGAGQGLGSNASVSTSKTSSTNGSGPVEGPRTNNRGESHCHNCMKTDNWAYNFPYLSNKQQYQLHMILESRKGTDEPEGEAHQLMHVMLTQGVALPNNRAYLDGCSTITAFKCKKYLMEVKERNTGIKINCNPGAVTTSLMGKYAINAWYIPKGIANFLMREPEKKHRITCDIWEGFCILYTTSGPVKFHKDEQRLPYIDLDRSGCKVVIMLLKTAMEIDGNEAKYKH